MNQANAGSRSLSRRTLGAAVIVVIVVCGVSVAALLSLPPAPVSDQPEGGVESFTPISSNAGAPILTGSGAVNFSATWNVVRTSMAMMNYISIYGVVNLTSVFVQYDVENEEVLALEYYILAADGNQGMLEWRNDSEVSMAHFQLYNHTANFPVLWNTWDMSGMLLVVDAQGLAWHVDKAMTVIGIPEDTVLEAEVTIGFTAESHTPYLYVTLWQPCPDEPGDVWTRYGAWYAVLYLNGTLVQ